MRASVSSFLGYTLYTALMKSIFKASDLNNAIIKSIVGYSIGGIAPSGFYICGKAKSGGLSHGTQGQTYLRLELPGKVVAYTNNFAVFTLYPHGDVTVYLKGGDSDFNAKAMLSIPVLINGKVDHLCVYLSSTKELK